MTPEALLLRQVHPTFVTDGRPTSQAFIPFPIDEGGLSVYDGDHIDASVAYTHYTQDLGNESESTWAVTQSEATDHGVTPVSAPLPDFPSHALIEFPLPENKKGWRKIAKKLKISALERGVVYRPSGR